MVPRRLALLFTLLLWPSDPTAAAGGDLPAGATIARVVCRRNAAQSYALYLPANYAGDRVWPILYAFDPGARGQLPVERFKEAAERLGVIVVGSNNSRNGPVTLAQDALNAMLADTRARFRLDPRRVYVTGFSGGARVAVRIGLAMAGQVAGVIGFGAGFPDGLMPTATLPFAYYAAVGTDDFNYVEMVALGRALEKLRLPHRFEVFDGGHDWPPEPVCGRALEWMELRAMNAGLRPADPALAEAVFGRTVQEAKVEERADRLSQAQFLYDTLAKDHAGQPDVAAYEQKARELERARAVVKLRADLRDSAGSQTRQVERVSSLLADTVTGEDTFAATKLLLMTLADLKQQSLAPAQSASRMVARRVLAVTWMGLSDAVSAELERGDFAQAETRLRVMAEMRPENAGVPFYIACARARRGDRKAAVEALQQAVDKGFSSADEIEREPSFEGLRDDPAFRLILERLRKGDSAY
jgi:dienelactone hydrolase